MLKRLILSLALAGLISPAFGAGTIPFSLSQQLDNAGKPLSGCKFYTIQAGTTSTPQNAYSDSALTHALPNPQTCDSAGRLPQMFLADGQIKVRLNSSNGVNILTADNIAVVGASSGSGGGGSVDATTVLTTGDFKAVYGTGNLTGFVRCNGRTVGSATSGASERANSDTSALFTFLWTNDSNLSVSTGRGVSAAADFAANKTIALPDCRGRSLAGLDDMGNSAASRLTATYFGTSAIVLGAAGGGQSATLITLNLPPYTPGGTVGTTLSGASQLAVSNGVVDKANGTGGTDIVRVVSLSTPTASSTFTGTAQGGVSTPVAVVSPRLLITVYLKL